MDGQREERPNLWISRAIRASGDACAWHGTSPALAEIRRLDAEWLMERFSETMRDQPTAASPTEAAEA